MKAKWPTLPFMDVISDETGGNTKTLQSEFNRTGKYAIVDQGKELIAGYTDDRERLCNALLPVIIFGDHTKHFKYVDFPFCLGADGTKVLRNRIGADQKFIYHYFKQLTLPDAGYSRHFKFLKEVRIPIPPLEEQRRIVAILDAADSLNAKRRTSLSKLDILAHSIFMEMFGDPAVNSQGWPTTSLISLVREGDTINYGVVQPGDDFADGVPLVRVGDILDGRVSHAALKRIDPVIEASYRRSRLRGDEVLVSCVGSIGNVALADESLKDFNIARAVARIPLAEATNRTFMAAYLKTDFVQRYFESELRTVSQPTLNIKQLSETKVVLPPISLQDEYARRVAVIEKLKSTYLVSLDDLNALLASLQNRSFQAES
jgi:type I restriction enzyme S subunit